MATYVLPYLGDKTLESFSTSLEGVWYEITIMYNEVDDSYSLQLGQSGFDPICKVTCLVGQDLLEQFRHLDVPAGTLEVSDTVGIWGRPTKGNFGLNKRFKLLYSNPR